jgi:hypothetical protein
MRNVYGERWTLGRIAGAAAIIGVIAFIAVRAIVDDESWTIEVENQTATTVAVYGVNAEGQGLSFEYIPAGETQEATVSRSERPEDVAVMFAAEEDDDGFPEPGAGSFVLRCSYDSAKATEPLIASGRRPLGCEWLDDPAQFTYAPSIER